MSSKNRKHLILQDRIDIQEGLSKGLSFKDIALQIDKSPTTVSREVKAHLKTHKNGHVRTEEICPRLLKAPFVCNACKKRSSSSCPYIRRNYVAKLAQASYEVTLRESRTGIPLNRESFYEMERVISSAVRKGQHLYHAIHSNKLPVAPSTVYRHIQKGYYSISPLDLPRAVKFKPRKENGATYVPKGVKIGRLYEDYLVFTNENPSLPVVQMDTVIGRIGGKVILTIHFVASDFMAGILLENKTASEAALKFSALKRRLSEGGFYFGDIAPLLLTDNGGEFSRVEAFECDSQGESESRVFFCEPCSPHEKAAIEKNHTLFRDIVPSGTSFDDFTQETVNQIFSHVNAIKRKQFNARSAYDMFTFSYSAELATAFGIRFIPPEEVMQSPKLLTRIVSK